jgi:hypothetical protein
MSRVENKKEAQRLLRLVARLQIDAIYASKRDIDTLCALGFVIHSEQIHPEQRTYWLETTKPKDQADALWRLENSCNNRALAILQEIADAPETPESSFAIRKKARLDAERDATNLFGSTLQVRNDKGEPVFKVTLSQRIVFNGKDGSEIRVGVDQDGDMRLWVNEQLVILPISSSSAKVIELHNRERAVQAEG